MASSSSTSCLAAAAAATELGDRDTLVALLEDCREQLIAYSDANGPHLSPTVVVAAVRCGREDIIALLLDAAPQPQGFDGYALLCGAVEAGSWSVARWLVRERGVPVRSSDARIPQCLREVTWAAAAAGQWDWVWELLQRHGGLVDDVPDPSPALGPTPLISAVQQCRTDAVRRLCKDFNAAPRGRPQRLHADALLAAAECGNVEALAYFAREQRQEVDYVMLGCGTPAPGRPNYETDTLIQRAAQLGHLPVVRLLAEELHATYQGSQSAAAHSVAASLSARPLLHCAIASGSVELVRYVVQSLHASLEEEGICDAVYTGPVPPLHAAGLHGDVPLLRFFVREAGLSPDMAEPRHVASGWRNGMTLLHWVAWMPAHQRWPVFDCLVNELGADKHATDARGYDALQDALTRGGSDTEPIRFLVEDCGYDPAAARYRTERWGERLLSLEALSPYNPCREAVLRMLLEHGADASARTSRRNTVAEQLLQSFHERSSTPELVRLLVRYGCPIPPRAALPAGQRDRPGKYPTAAVVAGRRAFTWGRRAHLAVAVMNRRAAPVSMMRGDTPALHVHGVR